MGRRYGNGDYENRPLHAYLGRSAEEMLEELKKADAQPDREHECLRTALGVGCRALTRFSHAFEDEEFLAGLERVEKNREDDRYLQFLHDIDLFEDFLEADQAVLKADGAVGKDAANALFKRARLLINEVRENAYSELRHELPETVAQLEDLTCGRAELLRREYAASRSSARAREKQTPAQVRAESSLRSRRSGDIVGERGDRRGYHRR
jgi:hypothetical protein